MMHKTRTLMFTLLGLLLLQGGTPATLYAETSSKTKKRVPSEALLNARRVLNGPLVNATKEEIDAKTAIKARATFIPKDVNDGKGSGTDGNDWVSGDRWYSPSSGLIKLSQIDDANKNRVRTADEKAIVKALSGLGAVDDYDKLATALPASAGCDDRGLPLNIFSINAAQMTLKYGPDYAQKIATALSDVRLASSAQRGAYQQSPEYAAILSELNLTSQDQGSHLVETLVTIRGFISQTINVSTTLDFSKFSINKLKGQQEPRMFTYNDLQLLKDHALTTNLYPAHGWGDTISSMFTRLQNSFPNLVSFAPTTTTTLQEAKKYIQAKTGSAGTRPQKPSDVKTLNDALTLLQVDSSDDEDDTQQPS